MRSILNLGLNDLRLTLRDKPAFFWLVVMPLGMMWFFGQSGGDTPQAPPRVKMSVVNVDQGWLSEAFLEALEDDVLSIDRLDPAGWRETPDRVRPLIIPESFTEGVLAGEKQILTWVRDPDSSATFGKAGEVHAMRAVTRTLGILVEMSTENELQKPDAAERFQTLAIRSDTILLDVSHAGSGQPVPEGYGQSVPGILTFIVLMMTLIYGSVYLTIEKQTGMLKRQTMLPVSYLTLISGKLCGRMMIAGVQLLILGLAGTFLFKVAWGHAPLAVIVLMLSYAAAVAALSTVLGAILTNAGQASIVGWLSAMVMAGLGGCWWPAEIMPSWVQTMSLATPVPWAMRAFHRIITFGDGLSSIWLPVLVLWGFAILFTLLAARLLRSEAAFE